MKQTTLVINNAIKNQLSLLAMFFRTSQFVGLSHWAKNVWVRILRISLFGEITENLAVEIVGHEMLGPCTMAIVHDNVHTWLVIADKVGVCKVDLQALSVIELTKLAGMLNGRIFPADMLPNDKTRARQELLQGEIEAMDDGSQAFYLAGL